MKRRFLVICVAFLVAGLGVAGTCWFLCASHRRPVPEMTVLQPMVGEWKTEVTTSEPQSFASFERKEAKPVPVIAKGELKVSWISDAELLVAGSHGSVTYSYSISYDQDRKVYRRRGMCSDFPFESVIGKWDPAARAMNWSCERFSLRHGQDSGGRTVVTDHGFEETRSRMRIFGKEDIQDGSVKVVATRK
ncbi:MAG: hypothetical protein U0793_15275 [Gemmataceae bacterium]